MLPLRVSAVLVAVVLALAGCGGDDGDGGGGGGGDGGGDGGGGGGGDASCEVSQEGYDLFSDPDVTTAPAEGAVYGDGEHQLSFVDGGFDAAAAPAYTFDLSYVDDGQAFPMAGGVLEGENGEVSTVDSVFTSEADGKAGLFTLIRTDSVGSTQLGVYCISLAVAE